MNGRGARGDDESWLGPCVAWILSAAPFFFDVSTFEGVSRTALAALPWIAYAGLPRGGSGAGWRGLVLEGALCLPTLALGAWIDVAQGGAPRGIARLAVESLAALAILSFSARATARVAWTRAAYCAVWFVLVAGLPIVVSLFALAGASPFGAQQIWLERLAGASPLSWIVGAARAEAGTHAFPWAPIALASVLLALAIVAISRARATDPERSGAADGASARPFDDDAAGAARGDEEEGRA